MTIQETGFTAKEFKAITGKEYNDVEFYYLDGMRCGVIEKDLKFRGKVIKEKVLHKVVDFGCPNTGAANFLITSL